MGSPLLSPPPPPPQPPPAAAQPPLVLLLPAPTTLGRVPAATFQRAVPDVTTTPPCAGVLRRLLPPRRLGLHKAAAHRYDRKACAAALAPALIIHRWIPILCQGCCYLPFVVLFLSIGGNQREKRRKKNSQSAAQFPSRFTAR